MIQTTFFKYWTGEGRDRNYRKYTERERAMPRAMGGWAKRTTPEDRK